MSVKDKDGKKSKNGFKNWYDQNKEDLAARRRDRYHSDPEYRRKILERGERYRKKKRAKINAEKPSDIGSFRVFRDENGKKLELYTISAVAAGVGRSVQCVNRWETIGYIPPTPFRYARVRYFTEEMINALAEVVGPYRRIPDPDRFKSLVSRAWKDLDLPSSSCLSPVIQD